MKVIGLLGGMSWHSTSTYYKIINEEIQKKLGGTHSAKCILYSVDFYEIERAQHREDWNTIIDVCREGVRVLKDGGADFLVICTNTIHYIANDLGNDLKILNIIDVTAEEILNKGIKKVALLGTRFTMEKDFYRKRLESYGINVHIPQKSERDFIHNVIYEELCSGHILEQTRTKMKNVVDGLYDSGADGIILGCTELGLIISETDTSAKIFDTTKIHALRAAHEALI